MIRCMQLFREPPQWLKVESLKVRSQKGFGHFSDGEFDELYVMILHIHRWLQVSCMCTIFCVIGKVFLTKEP